MLGLMATQAFGVVSRVNRTANLTLGVTYCFTATALDNNGLESDYSNEVSYWVPAGPRPPAMKQPTLFLTSAPVGQMILGQGDPGAAYLVEAVPDLASPAWEPLGSTEADTSGEFLFVDAEAAWVPRRFYRALGL